MIIKSLNQNENYEPKVTNVILSLTKGRILFGFDGGIFVFPNKYLTV